MRTPCCIMAQPFLTACFGTRHLEVIHIDNKEQGEDRMPIAGSPIRHRLKPLLQEMRLTMVFPIST